MNSNSDKSSAFVNNALEFLFTKYPSRTSIGIVLGLVLAFLNKLFLPYLKTIEFANFEAVPPWGWIPVGILIVHLPTLLSFLFTKPTSNESIEEVMVLIENGEFTKQERKQQYRILINKISENVALTQNLKQQMDAVESEVKVQSETDGDNNA